MIKITDLKEGTKAIISINLHANPYSFGRSRRLVTICGLDLEKGKFLVNEFGWLTIEMIECIISTKVSAIEALAAMEKGMYALGGNCLYKTVDKEVMFAHKTHDKPWEFTHLLADINAFLRLEFEILNELPEWAKAPKKNIAFKVGDITTFVTSEDGCGEQREVTEVRDSGWLRQRAYDGEFISGPSRCYRLATLEERTEYYEKAYKHLKNN